MMLVRRYAYYFRSIFTLLTGIVNWPAVIAAFVGLPLKRPFVVQLRQSGLCFKVRGPMDVWIVKETCLDHDYERAARPIQDGWNVIDIGAGVGDFAIYAAQCNPRGVIHAYEPFPGSFELLQQNLRLNKVSNVAAFPEAVSGQAGVLKLNMSGEAVQYSTAQASHTQDSISVPSVTLSDVLSRLNGAPCDLLKLDCEGAEYDILMKADESCWQRTRRIVLEYHNGVTTFSHQDLIAFFEKRACSVRYLPSRTHKHWGFLYIVSNQGEA